MRAWNSKKIRQFSKLQQRFLKLIRENFQHLRNLSKFIFLYHLLINLIDVGWKEEKAASWVARRGLRSVRISSLNLHLLDNSTGDKGILGFSIFIWKTLERNSEPLQADNEDENSDANTSCIKIGTVIVIFYLLVN